MSRRRVVIDRPPRLTVRSCRMRWLAFFGATVFAVTASGQCIEGVPAAYPLGEQVALHVLDPDCSFEAKWKKHLADPSVDSVGLIYHERISVPAMELMKSNPSSGQTLAVWGLDGESSTKATTTTATDIGGDYSAYVLTVQAPSCNSARIGSIVTTPNKTEVAGFVRKVIEGPQCTLHVIKPSSIRSLLSVQVPVGAPLVKLGTVVSSSAPRKMVSLEDVSAPPPERSGAYASDTVRGEDSIPVVFIVKNQKTKVPEWWLEKLSKELIYAWREKQPTIQISFPFRQANESDWIREPILSGHSRQVLIFSERKGLFTRMKLTIAVQNRSHPAACVESRSPNGFLELREYTQEIVEIISRSACFQAASKIVPPKTSN